MDTIDKINLYLAKQGKTGADLSRALGLSNSVYSQWNTKRNSPRKSKLPAIAEYLCVTVEELLPDEAVQKPTENQKSPVVSKINALLAEKGISKQDFYRDCGISSAAFSLWNTGKSTPRVKNLGIIADYLGVPLSELLANGIEQPPTPPEYAKKPAAYDGDGLTEVQKEAINRLLTLDEKALRKCMKLLDLMDEE